MKSIELSELELFDHYDPINDELPPALRWTVGSIPQRARLIVGGRTLPQLKVALRVLRRWRIFAVSNGLPKLQEIYGDLDGLVASDTQAMYWSRKDFNFSKNNASKLGVAELLATLALAKVGALVAGVDEDDESVRGMLAIEAMEALGFAEALWLDQQLNRQRGAGQKAYKQRRFRPVKRWLVEEYQTVDRSLSNRKTGRTLAERMPEDMRRLFATEDIGGQLAIWIGKYKKGSLDNVEGLPPFQ